MDYILRIANLVLATSYIHTHCLFQVGYMLHDRVLRPAEVGVTEGGAAATVTEAEEAEQPEQKTAGD
jgi:hypothetical protein